MVKRQTLNAAALLREEVLAVEEAELLLEEVEVVLVLLKAANPQLVLLKEEVEEVLQL